VGPELCGFVAASLRAYGSGVWNRAFPHLGIPHVILLDAAGTVVYTGDGLKQDALLAAIAKLGPEYAAALPK
jgi:hypothetical protein